MSRKSIFLFQFFLMVYVVPIKAQTLYAPSGPVPTLNGGAANAGALFYNNLDGLLYTFGFGGNWEYLLNLRKANDLYVSKVHNETIGGTKVFTDPQKIKQITQSTYTAADNDYQTVITNPQNTSFSYGRVAGDEVQGGILITAPINHRMVWLEGTLNSQDNGIGLRTSKFKIQFYVFGANCTFVNPSGYITGNYLPPNFRFSCGTVLVNGVLTPALMLKNDSNKWAQHMTFNIDKVYLTNGEVDDASCNNWRAEIVSSPASFTQQGTDVMFSSAIMNNNTGNFLINKGSDNGVDKVQINGSIEANAVKIKSGGDLQLRGNGEDSGDLVFQHEDGNEIGRIWYGQNQFLVRFGASAPAYSLLHSGNVENLKSGLGLGNLAYQNSLSWNSITGAPGLLKDNGFGIGDNINTYTQGYRRGYQLSNAPNPSSWNHTITLGTEDVRVQWNDDAFSGNFYRRFSTNYGQTWSEWNKFYHSGNLEDLKNDLGAVFFKNRAGILEQDVDANLYKAGIYGIGTGNFANTSSNFPLRNSYGALASFDGGHENGLSFQLYSNTVEGGGGNVNQLYYRSSTNSWRRIAFTDDSGNYAVKRVRTSTNGEVPLIFGTQHTEQIAGYAGLYLREEGHNGYGQAAGLSMKVSKNDQAPFTAMHVSNAGNIGIGTVDPVSKLQIFDGSLFISRMHHSFAPSIDLAIGDADTGIDWNGDGNFSLKADGVEIQNIDHDKVVFSNSKVGIGTGGSTLTVALTVNGDILTKGIKINPQFVPDYVFKPEYKLRPLSEVEAFVKANSHLPEVPSEAEVKKNGLELGEMSTTLLKKVEELTLYLIELKKENASLKAEISQIKQEIKKK